MQSILASYHKINEVEDDYDACQRRFSSRLMSTSSSGTTGDDLAGDDRWQMSDIDGSPEKTIYSSRDGIPSQVFPSALQNVVSKFIKNCNNAFCDDKNIQIESFTGQGSRRDIKHVFADPFHLNGSMSLINDIFTSTNFRTYNQFKSCKNASMKIHYCFCVA